MLVILGTGALWGALWFSVGFFGPMIFGGGNQGPLLGILITGPLGFLVGCGVGTYRVLRGTDRVNGGAAKRVTLTARQRGGVALIAGFLAEPLLYGAINSLALSAGLSASSVVISSVGAGCIGGAVAAHIATRARFAHGALLAAIQMALAILGSLGHGAPGAAREVLIQGASLSIGTLVGAYVRSAWPNDEDA